MVEPARTDPFTDVISLVAGPIAAVIRSFDQLRKGADEMRRGFENFNTTMENLNETAERINRLLNDFEEPVRAMIPQLTRTVKLADEMSKRLSVPIDEVTPGLTRLANTLELARVPCPADRPRSVPRRDQRAVAPAVATVAVRRPGDRSVRWPAHPRPAQPVAVHSPATARSPT